jgi:cob(I)alamin adenosyltransferase
VKKATLQNPVHKDTTRVDIMAWLDALNATLMQTRADTRDRVTAVADTLSADLAHLSQAKQALEARLQAADAHIKQLQQENALLKSRLGTA